MTLRMFCIYLLSQSKFSAFVVGYLEGLGASTFTRLYISHGLCDSIVLTRSFEFSNDEKTDKRELVRGTTVSEF